MCVESLLKHIRFKLPFLLFAMKLENNVMKFYCKTFHSKWNWFRDINKTCQIKGILHCHMQSPGFSVTLGHINSRISLTFTNILVWNITSGLRKAWRLPLSSCDQSCMKSKFHVEGKNCLEQMTSAGSEITFHQKLSIHQVYFMTFKYFCGSLCTK